MIFFLLGWLFGPFGGPPEGQVSRFLPCRPGLSVRYRSTRGEQVGAAIEERILGQGREPHTCEIERRTARSSGPARVEVYAIEHLPDRVANAGWVDTPTAFRPPLLIAPLAVGQRWHFNRSDFRVLAQGESIVTPAGTFTDTVRVEERASDSSFHSERVYAAGIGLVLYTQGAERLEALSVSVP